jgi:uncharacterized protein (TIGR00251 family)
LFYADEHNSSIVYLKILVQAGAKEQKIVPTEEELKVYLKASPIKGKANKELITLISKTLKLKKTQINIIRGHKSRQKVIAIRDCSLDQLSDKIDEN